MPWKNRYLERILKVELCISGKKKKIFFFFLFLFSLVAIFYQYQLVSIAPNVPMKCDPSAGSPTETLLRLLLPLDDKAY